MKKAIAVVTLALLSATVFTVRAQVPTATYRWNFNQAAVNSTNYLFPTLGDGTVPVSPGYSWTKAPR